MKVKVELDSKAGFNIKPKNATTTTTTFCELKYFFTSGWDQFDTKTFLGGTSEKTHYVDRFDWESFKPKYIFHVKSERNKGSKNRISLIGMIDVVKLRRPVI